MSMEAIDAIMTRRSTRRFKAEVPADDLIDKLVRAGRYAPSGSNSQSNHFFVVTDKTVIDELARMAEEAFAKMEADDDTYVSLKSSIMQAKKGGYHFAYHAPVLIIVANKKDYGNNVADVACAIENIMIAANDLDLGTCWVNQLRWLNEDEAILAYLKERGLKDDERVYGSVIVGYPDGTPDGKPHRKMFDHKGNEVTYIK